eukprot:XP_001704719.1 Hypothetical protein GL50803_20076 [Giardia lamblia ATCC 50803]
MLSINTMPIGLCLWGWGVYFYWPCTQEYCFSHTRKRVRKKRKSKIYRLTFLRKLSLVVCDSALGISLETWETTSSGVPIASHLLSLIMRSLTSVQQMAVALLAIIMLWLYTKKLLVVPVHEDLPEGFTIAPEKSVRKPLLVR